MENGNEQTNITKKKQKKNKTNTLVQEQKILRGGEGQR